MNETLQYWIGISEHSCGSSMPIGACLACDMVTIQKELTTVTEQRDGLRSGIDYASDQLHKVTEQRDRLADALQLFLNRVQYNSVFMDGTLRGGTFDYRSSGFDSEVEQAYKALTAVKGDKV